MGCVGHQSQLKIIAIYKNIISCHIVCLKGFNVIPFCLGQLWRPLVVLTKQYVCVVRCVKVEMFRWARHAQSKFLYRILQGVVLAVMLSQ